MQTIRVIVEGKVQGVGFRHHVCTRAQSLSLKGYVKNLSDGRVEILAVGEESVLNELLYSIRKGPAFAMIIDFHVEYLGGELVKDYSDFRIVYENH